MAIKSVQMAAPVSKPDQKRFWEELKKGSPVFNKGELSEGVMSYRVTFDKADRSAVVQGLNKQGWERDKSFKLRQRNAEVYSKEGRWPIVLSILSYDNKKFVLNIPASDSGVSSFSSDKDSFDLIAEKKAKEILPSGYDYSHGVAFYGDFEKSEAEVRKKVDDFCKKLLANGFKRVGSAGEDNTDVYIDSEGWRVKVVVSVQTFKTVFQYTLSYGKKRETAAPHKMGQWVCDANDPDVKHDGPYIMLVKDRWKSTGFGSGAVYVALDDNFKLTLYIDGVKPTQYWTGSPEGLKPAYDLLRKNSSGQTLPSSEALAWLYSGKFF